VPGHYSGDWAAGNTHRVWKGIEGGVFIQDDIRITDFLTVSAGLRWEYFGVPTEHSGVGINMPAFGTEEGFNSGQLIEGEYNEEGIRYMMFDGRELLGKKLWNPFYKGFAPKFSFAWDATRDGKTSIRGGVGIAYDRTFNNTYENDRFNYPDFTFCYAAEPVVPTIPFTVPYGRYQVALRWMMPDLMPQYAWNWLFGIQRQLAPGVSIEVDYTGSLGRRLGTLQRPNRFTGDGVDGVYDGINPYGNIRDVNTREQNYKSEHHAVQVILTKRFSDGWSWYSSYTMGDTKDQNSDYFGDATNMERVSHERPDDEWGMAEFHHAHRFVGGFVWDLPFFKNSENWILKNIIAGWQLSSSFHWTSGRVFNIGMYSMTYDWNLDGNDSERPIWLGDDRADAVIWNAGWPGLDTTLFGTPNPPAAARDMTYYNQNFLERNYFRWFPSYNIDISATKYFTIPFGSRDVTIQVIAEVFNLLNNTFWALPNRSMSSAAFGDVARKNGERTAQFSIRVMF
jgi:hypothetical protein